MGQASRDLTLHAGTTLTGMVGAWNWNFTGNYDRATSRTTTDRGFDIGDYQARVIGEGANPFATLSPGDVDPLSQDRARSTVSSGNAQLVVNGTLFRLPAGAVSTTVKIAGETRSLESRSVRSDIEAEAELSRDIGTGQISIDVPIASRRADVLAFAGDLSANFNVAVDRLSDFGTLTTYGYGLTWKPDPKLTLLASFAEDEGAPTVQQLGNPTIVTTGVRVFDYVRGETVEISQVTGGNPALDADNRRVIKLGATLKPLDETDLSITANYVDSRIRNPIASFPTATAAIEAAFPERFTRDDEGRLLRIDSRPVNFQRQDRTELRWGINFSKRLSEPPREPRERGQGGEQPSLRDLAQGGEANRAEAPPTGGTGGDRDIRGGGERGNWRPGGGPPGGFRGPGGGPRGTRLQLAAYHTVHFKDEILIRDGVPVLDLLDGAAIGSSGGQPRHEIEGQAGITHNGLGARLSLNWQSSTSVDGTATGGTGLDFSDLTTLNLRLFADLGAQRSFVESHPFFRRTRISLGVNNLTNARIRVRDETGETPLSYQPAYLDALGRSVRLSFRKLF